MSIIAILNNAGGVGKTAAVASLSALAAMRGGKSLAVDIDPQATLTRQFMRQLPATDIGSALRGGPLPVAKIKTNLDLVPSSPLLVDEARDNGDYFALARALTSAKSMYDIILIDCPPSLGYLSRCAVVAADYILSPVLPDLKSLYGLSHLESVVDDYARKAEVGIDGVFLANYDGRRKLDWDVAAKLAELYDDRFYRTRIRRCNKVRECLREWSDVASYAPRSNAAVDYRHLLDELLDRLTARLF